MEEEVTMTPDTATGTENAGNVEAVTTETPKAEEPKSYTQAEVDEIVQNRLERERKNAEKKSGVAELRAELEQLKAKNLQYETDRVLSQYEIADDFKEFVTFKVNQSKGDKSFAEAVKEFCSAEQNKKYLRQQEQKEVTQNWIRPANVSASQNTFDTYLSDKYGDVKPLNGGKR